MLVRHSLSAYASYIQCRCPRFILHYHSEEEVSLHQPKIPSLHLRPHSTIPMTYQHHSTVPGSSVQSLPHHYQKKTTPSTPSRTPTFKRLTASSRHRSKSSPVCGRSYSGDSTCSLRDYEKIRQIAPSPYDTGIAGHHENRRPYTVDGSRLHKHLSRIMSSKRANSRRVWDKGSCTGSPKASSNSPSTRNSQRIKYTPHYIPDPNSRCASSDVVSIRLSLPRSIYSQLLFSCHNFMLTNYLLSLLQDRPDDTRGMCENRCQILSVSGTPLHSTVTSPIHYSSEMYTFLLRCLSIEQRKAGGYFQNHLETLENKVRLEFVGFLLMPSLIINFPCFFWQQSFLHSLLFWREVQEYKALFVATSFSPCSVEMKAKVSSTSPTLYDIIPSFN